MKSRRSHTYKELSLSQLRTFLSVHRHRSITEAGRELGLSKPTVSEQLRALERFFGVPLFQRRSRRMVPSPAADRLQEAVHPLLAGLDSLRDVLHEASGRLPERIALLSGPRILLEDLMAPLAQFQRNYPAIRLQLLHTEQEDLDAAIAEGKADLAVTLEPGPHTTVPATVVHEPAYELEFLLVVPSRHPLSRRTPLTLEQIVHYPLVVGRPEAYARRRLEEVFYRHGLLRQMRIAVETSSDAFTLGCVRAGMGIGIVAGQPQGLLCRGLQVRSLKKWFGVSRFVFVWQRGAVLCPSLRELADMIRKHMMGHL